MKNIESIIAEQNLQLTEEQTSALVKAVGENYKTIAEFEKKDAKIGSLTEQLALAQETLKTFEGIDAEAMKKQITDLTASLEAKEQEFAQRMSDRDFTDKLTVAINGKRGLNHKAIISLLDVDTLKASSNQDADIETALNNLMSAEDSKMLFQNEETKKPIPNPIGSMGRTTTLNPIDDKYKGNPWYKPSGN